jgi:hypothetical protein
MRIRYPGLNSPIPADTDPKNIDPIVIEDQSEEERANALTVMQTRLAKKPSKKNRRKEKLTPMERGFTGGTWLGQKLGPPPSIDGVDLGEFECVCLQVH